MTVVDDVKRAKNSQEGMLALAAGIDAVDQRVSALLQAIVDHAVPQDSWDEWSSSDAGDSGALTQGLGRVQDGTVELPPASAEKQAQRRLFAGQRLRLNTVLPEREGVDWDEVYVEGGPIWLYGASRETVMSLPYVARQLMIKDVEEDNVALAAEMAADMLKRDTEIDFEGGSGAMAVLDFTGKK